MGKAIRNHLSVLMKIVIKAINGIKDVITFDGGG